MWKVLDLRPQPKLAGSNATVLTLADVVQAYHSREDLIYVYHSSSLKRALSSLTSPTRSKKSGQEVTGRSHAVYQYLEAYFAVKKAEKLPIVQEDMGVPRI